MLSLIKIYISLKLQAALKFTKTLNVAILVPWKYLIILSNHYCRVRGSLPYIHVQQSCKPYPKWRHEIKMSLVGDLNIFEYCHIWRLFPILPILSSRKDTPNHNNQVWLYHNESYLTFFIFHRQKIENVKGDSLCYLIIIPDCCCSLYLSWRIEWEESRITSIGGNIRKYWSPH